MFPMTSYKDGDKWPEVCYCWLRSRVLRRLFDVLVCAVRTLGKGGKSMLYWETNDAMPEEDGGKGGK